MSTGRGQVLHVTASVETGLAHVVEDYVRRQCAAGWEVSVACPIGSLAELSSRAGARVHSWHAVREPGVSSTVRELRSLAAVIRCVKPDLVHLHSAKAGMVGRLLLRGRQPTIFTPHAWSWLAVDGAMRRLVIGWERFAVRWCDALTCVSASELDEGRAAGIRGRLLLLANEVDPHELRKLAPPTRNIARAQVGVPPQAPLAVCCARLAPQKGQDLLLAAWPQVREHLADAQLVLVGSGPSEASVKALAADLKGVSVIGARSRDDALSWMMASDVVVCPSRYEGMSLVPLEAAALGRHVVASDVQGMRDGPGEPARRLVPPGDARALAVVLSSVLIDRETADGYGRLAAAWADREMTGDSAGAQLIELYETTIADRRGVPPVGNSR